MKSHFRVFLILVLLSVFALNAVTASSGNQRLPTKGSVGTSVSARALDSIVDGSFEAGPDSGNWVEASSVFGTPLCDIGSCGVGGDPATAGPRTGDIWAWFGGTGGDTGLGAETGSLSQLVTISDNAVSATLEFYLWIGLAGGETDGLTVTVDETEVFSALETETAYQAGYTLVSVDVSDFADGLEHTLTFTGTDLTAETSNINVDDVSLTVAFPDLIVNGGFEPDLAGWTLKNSTSDVVKCNTETKTVAYEGECAFRFKGGVGENSQITQTADLTGLSFASGDTLDLSAFVSTKNAAASGYVKVKVTYTDETPATKLKVNFVSDPEGDYQELTGQAVIASSAIDSVKTSSKNKSTSSKVYVDAISLGYTINPPALIPLPQ